MQVRYLRAFCEIIVLLLLSRAKLLSQHRVVGVLSFVHVPSFHNGLFFCTAAVLQSEILQLFLRQFPFILNNCSFNICC